MKLNGYDAAEIDRLVPPSPTEKIMSKLQQPLETSPRNRFSTIDDNDRPRVNSASTAHSQQGSPRKAAVATLSQSARRATMNTTSTTVISPEKGMSSSPSSAAVVTSRPRSGSAKPGNSTRRQQGGSDAATNAANREKKEAERVRNEAMAAAEVEEQVSMCDGGRQTWNPADISLN